MNKWPHVHLHTPEKVARFRRALDDEPIDRVRIALADLARFQDRSYFIEGDAGSFTYQVIWNYLRDRGALR